jgi:hypothetical protein
MDTDPAPPPIINEDAARRASLQSLLIFLDNQDAGCPQCGYSLRGIGSDHCPECGWAITLRPSDGIDRRRVLLLTSWIAAIGLIISLTDLLHGAITWFVIVVLPRGGGLSRWSTWLIFQPWHVVLLVLSAATLLRVRRMRTMPTSKLLRQSRRFSLAILITIAVVCVGPLVLRLINEIFGWMAG